MAELSPKVATHPEPPLAEKLRILAYLASNASEFRALDEQTHESAHAMEQAAERGDGEMVIQSFARVQENRLGYPSSSSRHGVLRTGISGALITSSASGLAENVQPTTRLVCRPSTAAR